MSALLNKIKRGIGMKVSLTRINNENTVKSTQIVTTNGTLKYVLITIIHH